MENITQKNEYKVGMIGQSGGYEKIQKAIKYFTRSNFSHSFIIVDGPYNSLAVLQTTEAMVTLTDIDHKIASSDYGVIYDVVATEEERREAILKTYYKYSGKWYGYLSYIWYIWRYLTGSKKCWKWASDGVTCTELVAFYLLNLNSEYKKLFDEHNLSALTPEDLRLIIDKNHNLFKPIGRLNNNRVSI